MKTLLTLLVLISLAKSLRAQDIIILKNGDDMNVKVTEITPDNIKFKKPDDLDGPSYSIPKSEVFFIKYKNGKKDIFNSLSQEFAEKNSIELGCDLSFFNTSFKDNYNNYNFSVVSFDPHLDLLITKEFELGIVAGITSVASGTSGFTWDKSNISISPAYNIKVGNATYIFIDLIAGFNSLTIRGYNYKGIGIGSSAGLKLQMSDNSLWKFGIRYDQVSIDKNNNPYSVGNSGNAVIEIGASILVPQKKHN